MLQHMLPHAHVGFVVTCSKNALFALVQTQGVGTWQVQWQFQEEVWSG